MSSVSPMVTNNQLLTQATDWISAIERGLSVEEILLQSWLMQSERHREIFREAAKLWDRLDSLNKLTDMFPETPGELRRKWPGLVSMAASILVIVVMFTLVFGTESFTKNELRVAKDYFSNEKTFETENGEISTVNLSDEEYLVHSFDAGDSIGVAVNWGLPRTWGVELKTTF